MNQYKLSINSGKIWMLEAVMEIVKLSLNLKKGDQVHERANTNKKVVEQGELVNKMMSNLI